MAFLEASVSSIIGVSEDVGSTKILAEDFGIVDIVDLDKATTKIKE
jgi:hypothetical protein